MSKVLRLTRLEVEQSKDSLPLTHFLAVKAKNSLKDCIVLHINHALSDAYAVNEFLVDELGAKVFFITTPYNKTYFQSKKYDYLYIERTANKYTASFNKVPVDIFGNSESVITAIHKGVQFAIQHIKKHYPHKKLIVLQDGGYTAAESSVFKKDTFLQLPNFLGMVEQTQGGTRLFMQKHDKKPLEFPVITISRSLIKMRVESHFIAQRIIEEVNRTIYKMGYFLTFKSVVVGGYGIIGRQVAKYLEAIHAKVAVLETHSEIQKLAQKEGYKTLDTIDENVINESFCYIGCTGVCTFGVKEFIEFLESKNKYYFLASGSSKQNEFLELISFFEQYPQVPSEIVNRNPQLLKLEDVTIIRNPNGVIEYICTINKIRKTLYLLAEGFPINLYSNDIQSVPDRAIDPIHALLVASVINLYNNFQNLKPGILHISDPKVKKIFKLEEEELLSDWFYLNDISAYRGKPFKFFKPHPLEKLLLKYTS